MKWPCQETLISGLLNALLTLQSLSLRIRGMKYPVYIGYPMAKANRVLESKKKLYMKSFQVKVTYLLVRHSNNCMNWLSTNFICTCREWS